jgi:hypothetical protein
LKLDDVCARDGKMSRGRTTKIYITSRVKRKVHHSWDVRRFISPVPVHPYDKQIRTRYLSAHCTPAGDPVTPIANVQPARPEGPPIVSPCVDRAAENTNQ